MNKIYTQLAVFIFVLFCGFALKGQACQITGGTTNLISSSGASCTFTTVLNFNASNANSANTITISSSAAMTTINSVTNPANITDSTSPFTFNSSFVGNYTITYTVPCNQPTTNFTFTYDGPGNGDCTVLTSNISLLPLSVNFVNFEISDLGKMTKLSFGTESETNNDYFSIERSSNGQNFETIDEVKGAGNSNEYISYDFYDRNPLNGLSFYRIKQVDFDGKFEYSDTKSVKRKSGSFSITSLQADGNLHIKTDIEDYTVHICNNVGQEIIRTQMNSGDQTLNLVNLKPGIYFVTIGTETLKFFKI